MPAVSKAQQIAMQISPQYVAGFLDGEGNITILERNRYKGQKSYGLYVGMSNCDLRPLQAIKARYGGFIFAKTKRSSKHRTAYEIRITKRHEVQALLESVLPYLLIKRERAELGLAFLALGKVKWQTVGRRKFHPAKGGTVPIQEVVAGEQEKRADFKARLMVMNARGPREEAA